MAEPQSSGWCYPLSPGLVVRTRPVPGGAEGPGQVLLVESGGAFPPGHPTTRLCLDLLKEALAATPTQNLADVGCGAGVLGLAAAALGVPRVAAVDIAWAGARATRKNARENGLDGQVQVAQGSTECLRGPFDLVVANLPYEVQVDKARALQCLGATGGASSCRGSGTTRKAGCSGATWGGGGP